jgi:hypothetical protein
MKRAPAQCGCSHGAAASGDGHDGSHDHSDHHAIDFASICPCRWQSASGGVDAGRRRPAARMGPVGEPARASPRAPGGGACDD